MVRAEIVGDRVLVSADSNELAKRFGWLGSGSNLPAAYLTGLLCGFKALASGVKEAVLDIGLRSPTRGSRVFAALKGVLDAGVLVPHDAGILPSEERIQGQHIVAYAKQLASNPELYQARFSEQLSRGLPPEQLAEHFFSVKEKIVSSFGEERVAEKKEKVEVKPKAKVKRRKRKKAAGKAVAKPELKPKSKRRVSKKRKKSEVEK
jgi:large subunit ribosomal protein L18